jgi:hypothetical protein
LRSAFYESAIGGDCPDRDKRRIPLGLAFGAEVIEVMPNAYPDEVIPAVRRSLPMPGGRIGLLLRIVEPAT